jgi:thiol-disulfide isomerase/thioredoxin
MRYIGRWLSLTFLLVAVSAAAGDFQARAPAPAPALRVQDLSGSTVSLADYRGRVVLLNFWASWCPPCRQEMPSMERLRKKMAGRPLAIVGVDSGESAEEVKAFLPTLKVAFPIFLDPDSENTRRWKVFALPTSFLVDAQGRVRYSIAGPTEWDAGEGLALIEKLLAEIPATQR